MKRDLLCFTLGAVAMFIVAYPVIHRQVEWEAKTVACWPTKDDPNPVRHP